MRLRSRKPPPAPRPRETPDKPRHIISALFYPDLPILTLSPVARNPAAPSPGAPVAHRGYRGDLRPQREAAAPAGPEGLHHRSHQDRLTLHPFQIAQKNVAGAPPARLSATLPFWLRAPAPCSPLPRCSCQRRAQLARLAATGCKRCPCYRSPPAGQTTGGVHFDLVKRVMRDISRSGQGPEEIIQQVQIVKLGLQFGWRMRLLWGPAMRWGHSVA